MEIIAIIIVLFLMAFMNSIQEYKFMKIIICIVTLFIGISIMATGITLGTTSYITSASNEAIILFVVMTLGSLMTAYAVATNEKKD